MYKSFYMLLAKKSINTTPRKKLKKIKISNNPLSAEQTWRHQSRNTSNVLAQCVESEHGKFHVDGVLKTILEEAFVQFLTADKLQESESDFCQSPAVFA